MTITGQQKEDGKYGGHYFRDPHWKRVVFEKDSMRMETNMTPLEHESERSRATNTTVLRPILSSASEQGEGYAGKLGTQAVEGRTVVIQLMVASLFTLLGIFLCSKDKITNKIRNRKVNRRME